MKLYLLGPPRIEQAGHAVDFDTRKAPALLAYLALTGQPQPRETLATLLWAETDDEHARGSLRRTLRQCHPEFRTACSGNGGQNKRGHLSP